MELFLSTLSRMAFLFAFILIGYITAKVKAVPEGAETVLSKLESYVFIPCLIISSFSFDFTVGKLSSAWKLVVWGTVIALIMVAVALFLGKLFAKDAFTQKICTYGIAIANIGFMGNAVVEAVFPEYFLDYLIYTIPTNVIIYIWAVPALLIPTEKNGIGARLKSFVNPMFISILIGMLLGLTGLGVYLPEWTVSVIDTAGSCMSPAAMLLTGMTVARIDLVKTFSGISIYALSALRLLIIPLCFIGVTSLIPWKLPETVYICALCAVSMPLGLNMVVIPGAYGRDTTVAAGMAIVSHLLSCITIPIVFSFVS